MDFSVVYVIESSVIASERKPFLQTAMAIKI